MLDANPPHTSRY